MGWIADLLKEIPSAARYKSELEAMEKQNATLQAENENLRQEVKRRDEIVKQQESHGQRLDEVKEKILLFVSSNQRSIDQQVAQAVGIGAIVALFHLEELQKLKMVNSSYISGSTYSGSDARTEWAIVHAGRGYLVGHGLIA